MTKKKEEVGVTGIAVTLPTGETVMMSMKDAKKLWESLGVVFQQPATFIPTPTIIKEIIRERPYSPWEYPQITFGDHTGDAQWMKQLPVTICGDPFDGSVSALASIDTLGNQPMHINMCSSVPAGVSA